MSQTILKKTTIGLAAVSIIFIVGIVLILKFGLAVGFGCRSDIFFCEYVPFILLGSLLTLLGIVYFVLTKMWGKQFVAWVMLILIISILLDIFYPFPGQRPIDLFRLIL